MGDKCQIGNGNFELVIYAKLDKWKLEWVINAKLENWKVECVITAMLEKRNSDCEIATFRVLELRGNTLYDMFEAINIRKTKKKLKMSEGMVRNSFIRRDVELAALHKRFMFSVPYQKSTE